jgi:hypothetical protein
VGFGCGYLSWTSGLVGGLGRALGSELWYGLLGWMMVLTQILGVPTRRARAIDTPGEVPMHGGEGEDAWGLTKPQLR